MALRRNPQRSCQEGVLLPVFEIPAQPGIATTKETASTRRGSSPRLTKRHAIKTRRRKDRALACPIPRPASNTPFPFFKLPREIRDQVYSSLVVRQSSTKRSIVAAAPLLQNWKRRVAAKASRERLNQKRILSGRPPARARTVESEPTIDLNMLQASQRLNSEAKDCLYTHNWFAIGLSKLPLTTFETPYGWDLSKIKRLQVEVQVKDAAHMNSYVDWTTFFASFPSLRILRIIPTFHPRYYDWSLPELSEWSTAHYIHKGFFRELLAEVPGHINLELGVLTDAVEDLQLQGKVVGEDLVREMYAQLSARRASTATQR